MHSSRRLIVQTLLFSRSYLHCQVSPPETLVVKGGTTWARNGRSILPENARLPRNIQGSFTCRKSTTWDRRLYFIPKEKVLRIFSPWKIRRLRSGFNPKNVGTKGQHDTSRPPMPPIIARNSGTSTLRSMAALCRLGSAYETSGTTSDENTRNVHHIAVRLLFQNRIIHRAKQYFLSKLTVSSNLI